MNKTFKMRVIALILVLQMTFSVIPMQAFAETSAYEAQHEQLLKEELRKAADEIQYPNGLFEFLVTSMNTSEDISSAEFAIVRKGGTTGEASVTFKAIDITAKYGDDYTISVQKGLFPMSLPNNPDSKPLIESFEDIENASITTGSSLTYEISQPTTGSSIQYEELPASQLTESKGGSGLRAARDAFTGTTSERTSWREADQDTKDKALLAQKEMFDEMPGVTYTFNFEDGEYIKKIRFNTIDDNISEDEEQVLFALLNPVGGSLGESISAYMNIEDNEEKEKVEFEMADNQITVDRLNGYAEVKVRRTEGLYRYGFIQVGTAALTAQPNIDYEPLSTQLNFVPGQETQTVRIPLLEGTSTEELQFIVKLDPESPNVSEDGNTKTIIKIKPKTVYLMKTNIMQPQVGSMQIMSSATTLETSNGLKTEVVNGVTYHVKTLGIDDIYSGKYVNDNNWAKIGPYYNIWFNEDLRGVTMISFNWKSTGSNSAYMKIGLTGNSDSISKTGKFDLKENYYLKSQDRLQKYIIIGLAGSNYDSHLYVGEVKLYYRTYNIVLKDIEGNDDAYIMPRTWKSAENSVEGPAQYVGSLAFDEDNESILKEYSLAETVKFVSKFSEDFKDKSKVYLWGYKIEKKGGSTGEDRYYHVFGDRLQLIQLFCGQLKDYSGNTIPLNDVLMDGDKIAVLPVFKAKHSFVQINFDPTKGGMDKNSFSNGQIIKVGRMDTIEIRAFASGTNAVSGYEHSHTNGTYRDINIIPPDATERGFYDVKTESTEIAFTDHYAKYFYPIDRININPSMPGELNFRPSKAYSKLTVSYDTSSLTVKADPTHGDKEKGSVAYIPDEGNPLVGNSENPMVVSPMEHNKMYVFSGVPDEGYRMVWKDWSGDINGDGFLDEEEVDNLGKYESNFDRKAVAGNFLTYVPTYDHPLIYYSFEPKGSSGSKGKVSGKISLKGKSILSETDELNKPLTGVSLNINGHLIYTDENGVFEIEHSDFRSNEYHNIIITYKGINYMGHVNVNAFTNIVIDEYDTFVPYNFKAINRSNNNEEIDFRIIDNRDANYKFSFEVKSLKQGISAAKAIIRLYSKDGIERIDSRNEVIPENGVFTFEFNPASSNAVPGDRMTVQLIDQNGLAYMEHNAGFVFKRYLNTFSLLSSFKSPLKPAVDLVGSVDAAFDLGLSGKIDEYMDKSGKNGTEWIISFGFSEDWEKSLSDGSSSKNSAAEDLKDAAKKGEIDDKVEKSVEKDGNNKKSSSITSDIKFGIATSLYLRMTVDKDGDAYFNEMIMSATFTGEYEKKVERMTPLGVTLFVGMNFKGGVTGMLVIEKYDDNFYFNENGEIDFSNSGTSNLDRDFTIYGYLRVEPSITLFAGAEITGANVTLDGTAAFDLNFTTTGSGSGKVSLSSELTLKILFFTYSWEIANKEFNLFRYGRTGNSMDHLLSDTSGLYESAENYDVMPRDYMNNRGQWQGGYDLLMSGYGLETIPQNEQILQTGIYPYPYTLLATIGENSHLLIFLDDDISHDDRNRTQLYFSIYNGSSWSIPNKIDDDDTPDGLPWLYDIGDKVLVAWSSSVFEIDSEDTVMSVLNNRNIKATFFNKADGTFEEVQEVTHHTKDDTFSDTEPYIAYWKNNTGKENLMIVYKKSDYMSTVGNEEDNAVVGDIINPYYSTLAYRFYDFDRNVWDDRAEGGEMPGMFYGQGFIDLSEYVYVDDSDILLSGYWSDVPTPGAISLEKLPGNDPYVVDANAIGYDNHAVLAYVVDLDSNQGTTMDREIFLQLYSFEEETFYPPIRLTDDLTGQYCLEFVSVGDDVYLYYLSDGDIQSMDIGYLMEEGLLEYEVEGEIEGTYNKVYVLNKLKNVYKSPETIVKHSYDVVMDENRNEIIENEILIDEYMVKSDDNFVYVVWGQGDITYEEDRDTENQYRENHIYAARKSIAGEMLEWSDAVKITEGKGANYNDFDFEILSDGMLRIVFVKGFSKIENVAGQLMGVEDMSNRILMTADYDMNERNTIVEINPVKVQKPNDIVPIHISIYNNSLSALNNITYEVWQKYGGVSEIIDDGELKLRGGEKIDLSVPWQAPDNLEDVVLQVAVKDGSDILCSDEHKIVAQSIIDVVEAYADFVGRNKVIVSGVAVNNGNIKMEEAVIVAESSGITLGSVNIRGLNVGETKKFMMFADINSEMFESNVNEDGSVESAMELSVHSKTGTGMRLNLNRYANGEDVAVINNIKSFSLKSGNSTILEEISMEIGKEMSIEPYLAFLDEKSNRPRVVYESSDEAVAHISASGQLFGQSSGTAVITSYAIPQINNIILSKDSFIKVDNLETLPQEAVKIKSFVVNVMRPGSNKTEKDDSEESVKPVESTIGKNKITFKDVAEDAWYYDAVSFIASRGITKGTGDGCFNPDGKLTRGQFIVMIMRAYGINPDEDFEDNFADAGDTYYTGYLAAVKRLGLSKGVGNDLFAPDNNITRQEMFTLLYRVLEILDELPKETVSTTLASYSDADQIDSWAKEAMTLFVGSGVIKGSGQKINPKDTTNRAQMAQVLYNLLKE